MMNRDELELLREFQTMRRQHQRGEPTQFGPAVISAVISYCQTFRALERLKVADGDHDAACLAAYESALGAVDALRIEQQRRLAAAFRAEGIDGWATLLPGFDEQFPGELEGPGRGPGNSGG